MARTARRAGAERRRGARRRRGGRRLAAIGTAGAVAALAALSLQDEDPRDWRRYARWDAFAAMAVVEVLQPALRATDSSRRLAAVEALIANGSAAAVEVLGWTATADAEAVVARGRPPQD